jgi:hypothetical protein
MPEAAISVSELRVLPVLDQPSSKEPGRTAGLRVV